MIAFSNPAWLWGLFGLLVPIAIHLLSRKEGKVIYMGSIRHLTDSDTAQFSSIRLNEILLLILRLLLITLMILLLAGMIWYKNPQKGSRWVLVEKGVEKKYSALIDTLTNQGFEPRWLASNFPTLEDSNQIEKTNYYSLVDLLNVMELDTAVVLSYSAAKKFKGELQSLPEKIQWVSLEAEPIKTQLFTRSFSSDSCIIREIISNAAATSLKYRKAATNIKMDTVKRSVITVSIFADKGFEYDRKIIQSALLAIQSFTFQPIEIKVVASDTSKIDSDFLVWLSYSENKSGWHPIIGFSKSSGSKLPLLMPREHFNAYAQQQSNYEWNLTERLTEENALTENLTVQLAKILVHDKEEILREAVDRNDQRSLPSSTVFTSKKSHGKPTVDQNRNAISGSPWVMALLLSVLLIERTISYKRKQ